MPFPTQREIEVPLLRMLERLGGQAKPRDLYESLADEFGLSSEERTERMESSNAVRWWNAVQWARQRLVQVGEVDRTVRGLWVLTDLGRKRIAGRESTASQSRCLFRPSLRSLP